MTYEQEFDQSVQVFAKKLLEVPILNQLSEIKLPCLHYLFSQLYYFVDMFPGLLGLLLWKLPDTRVRFAIVDNLVDECGSLEKIWNNDPSLTHSSLLKYFVQSIHENGSLAEKSVSTNVLLANFSEFYINATPIQALASMTAMEVMSSLWFKLIYQQLLDRKDIADKTLYFFEIHTRLDEEHGQILKDVLFPHLQTAESRKESKNGIHTSMSIWLNFYEAITREIEVNVQ